MSVTHCVEKLKVLADPTRLAVIECLFQGPLPVNALAQLLSVEQSLLSHHLKVLRQAELVIASRQGKQVIYSLATQMTQHSIGKSINLGCCALNFDALAGREP